MKNFSVKTTGHCFLCLRRVSPQLTSEMKAEVELDADSDRSHPMSVSYAKHSLQYLSHYLKLNLGAVLKADTKASQELSLSARRLKAVLCEGCADLNGRFAKLYQQLERVQIEVTDCLNNISSKLKKGDEGLCKTLLGERDAKILGALRKEAMDKCFRKLDRDFPRVRMIRMTSKNLVQGKTDKVLLPEPGAVRDNNNSRQNMPTRSCPKSRLEIIIKRDTLTGKYKCPACDKEFTQNPSARSHYRSIHLKLRNFTCGICGKQFSEKSNLRNHHRSVHLKIRPYQCDECGKKFCLRGSLEKHRQSVHLKLKLYQCKGCGKQFGSNSKYLRHQRLVHSKKLVPLVCEHSSPEVEMSEAPKVTERKLATTPSVTEEVADTTTPRFEPCGTLLKSDTVSNDSNEISKMTMTENSSISSGNPDCSAIGDSKSSKTVRRGSGGKKARYLTCLYPGCGKRYAKTFLLTAHIQSHTGEKPHQCSWEGCGWKFWLSSDLTRHYRKHTGDRPFRCGLCDQVFSRADYLSLHMKKRHGRV